MKRLFTLAVLVLPLCGLFAQVRGISYTLAPTVSYNWFNDASGLDDAFMVGGRIGFGFGEYVELRGIYMQTISQGTDFAGLDLDVDESFLDTDVDLARYGGELKLNLGRGTLLPYLTVGGGIQDIGREGLDEAENIYGTAGLGITLSAADRYTLGLEGKYIGYSFNAAQNLFDEAERAAQNLDFDEFDDEQIGTYSVAATLQFYLGGRRPGQLSDIDREYREQFQGGLSGLSIPLEIGIARVDWDDALAYQDTYLAGASAGFNFGPLVSLRGFYYQGMTEGDLNFDFNDLAIYGGDFRFNLSQASTGLVPFLSVGGGYIDINADYNQDLLDLDDNATQAESQGFVSGGGGVNLRFNDRFVVQGGVRSILTSATEFDDVSTTDQITSSWMYNAGLKVNLFGDNDSPSVVSEDELDNRLDAQEERFESRLDSIRAENRREVAQLREKYESRIVDLNEELVDALEEGDTEAAAEIKKERAQAEEIVTEIERRQDELRLEAKRDDIDRQRQELEEVDIVLGKSRMTSEDPRVLSQGTYNPDQSRIVLRPDELNNLVDRLGRAQPAGQVQPASYDDRLDRIMARLDRMEDRMYGNSDARPVTSQSYRSNSRAADLNERLRRLEAQLEEDMEDTPDQKNRTDRTRDRRDERDLEKQIQELEKRLEDRRQGRSSYDRDTNRDRQNYDRDYDRNYYGESDPQRRLDQLERRLMDRVKDMENMSDDDDEDAIRKEVAREMADYQSELLREIEDLKSELEDTRDEIDDEPTTQELVEENANLQRQREIDQRRAARRQAREQRRMMSGNRPVTETEFGTVTTRPTIDELNINSDTTYLSKTEAGSEGAGFFDNVTYGGMSGVAGINIGDASFLNLGLRWHYKIGAAQRLEFMPEAYFGLGDPSTFGIFGNVLSPILRQETPSRIRPYVGAGVGFMQVEDDDDDAPEDALNFTPAINLLIGTYIPVGGGRVFADFATRNFFQNSVLSAGYRFNF